MSLSSIITGIVVVASHNVYFHSFTSLHTLGQFSNLVISPAVIFNMKLSEANTLSVHVTALQLLPYCK